MTSRHYCFTIFEGHLEKNPEWNAWEKLPEDTRYIVWQIEKCDKTDNIHIQGYIEFTRSVTPVVAQILMGTCAHMSIRKGTRDEARNYCMKEDTRMEGPWELGKWEMGGQGSRNDLRNLKKIIDEGGHLLDCYEENFGSMVRFGRGIERYAFLRRGKNKTYSPKTIEVFVGPTRTGKSRKARELLGENFYEKPDGQWFDGYDGEENVLMDDFDWRKMDICLFLKVTDNYPCPVQVKQGFTYFTAKRIIITTNEPIESWYPNESPEHRQAIVARITAIHSLNHLVEVRGNNTPSPKKVDTLEKNDAEEYLKSLEENPMEVPIIMTDYI